MTFDDWKMQYAHRVRLMAGFKTVEYALENLPHDDILRDCWSAGELPNEAADAEMADWDE